MRRSLFLYAVVGLLSCAPKAWTRCITPDIEIVQQNAKWEDLGQVTLAFYDGRVLSHRTMTGELFVCVIQGRTYYKVIVGKTSYSVSLGSFRFDGKRYNAKISNNWYFNI